MRAPGNISLVTLIASGGFATLLVAGVGAYVSLDERVATRPTAADVRQVVTDMTLDKMTEINHRLAHLEESMDRLTAALAPRAAHGAADPENWPHH